MNKFFKSLTVIIIVVIGVYFLIFYLQKNILPSERHSGLDKIITQELFDSVKVGLEKFKILNNHYPNTSGKYFFDSIKTFVSIPDVYVYADSINSSGEVFPIKKQVGEMFNYKNLSNTYLGVGNKDLVIIYKYLSENSFKLYSVGANYLDENGAGDDILY